MNIKKLKARIMCWYFPGWFDSGHSHGKFIDIELDLNELTSIRLTSKNELPHLNYYLTLDERLLENLFEEINKSILSKYNNVTEIDLHSYSQKVYNPDFTKEIPNWTKIFEVPAGENTQKVHKKKNYHKYFKRNLFEKVENIKKPFFSEYIGFTGKSKEQLSKGEEFRCEILFENPQDYKIEYIFIDNISKIVKKWSTGPISEYFIIPHDFIEQANLELVKILAKYNNIKEVKIQCKLYDESIKAFDQSSPDNLKFERNIDHFLILNYKIDTGLQLTRIQKGKHQTFIESKRVGSSNYRYEELEEKYGYLDFEDNRHDDDWQAYYYSSFL